MEIGEKYGRLTTIRELPERNYGHVMWLCQCECGKTTKVQRDRLLNGHTRSCGCAKKKHIDITKGTDITGQRFGRLVVKEWLGTKFRGGQTHSLYRCECDCGNTKDILRMDLLSGRIVSCGCYALEVRTKHGGCKERLYPIWHAMIGRCRNSNNKYYYAYGGRGIRVCDEWNDYSKFREWAMNNGYNPEAEYLECTIDRIDVNGNYEPDNCRFVDFEVQANNTRRTIKIEMDGTIKSLKQWCNYLDCNYEKACHRKKVGKDIREWFDKGLPYKDVKIV